MIAGVPYDAEVEYLESTGTQWIDTGVQYTSKNVKVSARIALPYTEADVCLIGSYNSNDIGRVYPISFYSNATIRNNLFFGIPNTNVGLSDGLAQITDTNFHDICVDLHPQLCKTYIDNLVVRTSTDNYSTMNNGLNQALFGRMYLTDCRYLIRCKLSFCVINDNNTLVRDFIPVRVGNVGYMYDRVTRKLFGNKGTGAFVLGPDVARPVMGLNFYSEEHR